MKTKVVGLNNKLKDVHKRFLENERRDAEKYFEKSIAPFEFLLMLTQNKNFEWLHPFSALISEIDAYVDEAEDITALDVVCIRDQIDYVIKNSESNIGKRYQHHLNNDADFIMLHSSLKTQMRNI